MGGGAGGGGCNAHVKLPHVVLRKYPIEFDELGVGAGGEDPVLGRRCICILAELGEALQRRSQ